jgi:hypothetical protein
MAPLGHGGRRLRAAAQGLETLGGGLDGARVPVGAVQCASPNRCAHRRASAACCTTPHLVYTIKNNSLRHHTFRGIALQHHT